MSQNRWLTGLFGLAVAVSAVHPYETHDYVLEIATPVVGFFLLWATARRFRFTALSYRLMFVEALILIVGAHYTHERVPAFDWLRDALGAARNDYDRLAHFAVGFLLVTPVREILARRTPLRGRALNVLSAICVLAFAAFYEITEWWIAVLSSPDTGAAYLGSQGDVWDAQKDMLLDGLGAIAGVWCWSRPHDRELTEAAGAAKNS
jgi:putative membrane protein